MKLLEKTELKGIDSTTSTIEKWDAFFKIALPNLGYKDDLLDRMYPYSRGIPLKGTDDRLPVDEITGRRFFKLSAADKLAGLLSVSYQHINSNYGDWYNPIIGILANVWLKEEYFKAFFPDCSDEDYNEYVTEIDRSVGASSLHYLSQVKSIRKVREYWFKFATNCEIYKRMGDGNLLSQMGKLTEEIALIATTNTRYTMEDDCSEFFMFYKPWEDRYDIDMGALAKLITSEAYSFSFSNCYNNLKKFGEVYTQDYMCVSLNPIDKFMCSTKQAFSSCMSIAKQDDTRGTSSAPAFGLPALFGTDGVYMVFMTPGKHKNMYWEESEWEKPGEERDKNKAYKYLKMTCRCLTYQGVPHPDVVDFCSMLSNQVFGLEQATEEQREDVKEAINKCELDKERLMIGRHYSTGGEKYSWPFLAELLLARAGVATGVAYVEEYKDFFRKTGNPGRTGIQAHSDTGKTYGSLPRDVRSTYPHTYIHAGIMTAPAPVEIDRYGAIRGIYYDNLTVLLHPNVQTSMSRSSQVRRMVSISEEFDRITDFVKIRVGADRTGSCSLVSYPQKSGLDMFKVMLGKQNYTYFNEFVNVCNECNTLITAEDNKNITRDQHGNKIYYCSHCMEKLEMKRCPSCGDLYKKADADEHKQINIREFTNKENYQELKPLYTCKKTLTEVEWDGFPGHRKYLCLQCGKVNRVDGYYRSVADAGVIELQIDSIHVAVGICHDCLKTATMCDRCKKVIFLNDVEDACLLLPKRRVICPDCVDSIRMKQENKRILKNVLANITAADLECVEKAEDIMTQAAGKVRIPNTLLKDINKQIRSYLAAHPEETFPVIRAKKLANNTASVGMSTGNTEVPEENPTLDLIADIDHLEAVLTSGGNNE